MLDKGIATVASTTRGFALQNVIKVVRWGEGVRGVKSWRESLLPPLILDICPRGGSRRMHVQEEFAVGDPLQATTCSPSYSVPTVTLDRLQHRHQHVKEDMHSVGT